MKNFNTERIEITLIFAGVFLGTHLFLIAAESVLRGIVACFTQ